MYAWILSQDLVFVKIEHMDEPIQAMFEKIAVETIIKVICLFLSYHRFALLGETSNFRGNFDSLIEFIPNKPIDQKDGLLFVRSQLEWFIPNRTRTCIRP